MLSQTALFLGEGKADRFRLELEVVAPERVGQWRDRALLGAGNFGHRL